MNRLPPSLALVARVLEILTPGLAYEGERAPYRHRAIAAATMLHEQMAATHAGGSAWRVRSFTKPGVSYFIDLDDLSCTCDDFTRAKANREAICKHLICAAFAEGQRVEMHDAAARVARGEMSTPEFVEYVNKFFGEAVPT